MKNIFLSVLVFFICLSGKSQSIINGTFSDSTLYGTHTTAGVMYFDVYKPVYKLMRRNDSVFARAGGVWAFQYKDSVGGGGGSSNKVDTIYRTPGKDSIQFTIDGRYHAIKDSSGGGSSDITVGTTVVNSGTNKKFAYNAAGVYGESAMLSQETNQILVSAPAGSTRSEEHTSELQSQR